MTLIQTPTLHWIHVSLRFLGDKQRKEQHVQYLDSILYSCIANIPSICSLKMRIPLDSPQSPQL